MYRLAGIGTCAVHLLLAKCSAYMEDKSNVILSLHSSSATTILIPYTYIQNGSKSHKSKLGSSSHENKVVTIYKNLNITPSKCLILFILKVSAVSRNVYLRPLKPKKPNNPWSSFKFHPLVVCLLLSRKMCEEAGITKRKTNHILRASIMLLQCLPEKHQRR